MKRLLFVCLLALTFNANAQTDYKLARAGDYILGVYIFTYCDPANDYDYIGKIDKFDIAKADSKELEKIISKAKKKNAFFDGMIIKREYDHIELIKFKEKKESLFGYKVGDIVQYEAYGKLRKGEIVDIDEGRKKVTVKYADENGKEKLDGVQFQELNRVD